MELNKSRDDSNTTKQNSMTELVLQECTNLVAVHGRPFTLIQDKAFRNILSLILDNPSAVSPSTVKENVKSMAAKMRDDLANTLKGRTISLKVDIASLATRSFMGINCQYLQEDQIILKNLGMIEIFQRHTSDHLKDLLIFNLLRFRIDAEYNKRIYCITTDNGSNMIKMGNLLNESCVRPSTATMNTSDDVQAGTSADQTFDEIVDFNNSNPDLDMEENTDHETEQVTTQVGNILREQFMNTTEQDNGFEIGIVRCAAHTLQLALKDACKNVATNNLISNCRAAVRLLRTPQFIRIIKQNGKNVPTLDCSTRWHSTVDMVESLLPLKEICDTDQRLYFPNSTWNSLEEFMHCLTPVKILTKKLQEEQLTIGDFYLSWMLCEFQLTKMTAKIAKDVVLAMKEREKTLFNNDVFINGIFLDPRVNSILTQEQQSKAKENLIKLYIRNFELDQSNKENNSNNNINAAATSTLTNETTNVAQNDLDDYLTSNYINKHDDIAVLIRRDLLDPQIEIVNELKQSLNLFLQEPLLKFSDHVLKYWENSKLKFPYLYKLSSVVLAAPMTQVSVERLFSSLNFVVSNLRFSMKDDIIEDLLFIRNNSIYNK